MIAILAVLSTTIGITFIYYNLYQNRVKEDLRVAAELLLDSGVFEEFYVSSEENRVLGERFKNITHDSLRITWIDAGGDVLCDNDTDEEIMENHSDRPEVQQAMLEGVGESVRRSNTLKMNTFYYAVRAKDGTIIRVATQARSVFSVFIRSFPILSVILIVITGLCIWISHMLTGALLAPIEKMAENLNLHSGKPVYRELVPFADKIRSQHDHILEASKVRQDFTASVTHELKTPLTAISGYAELIENHITEPGQEIYFARQIRENANRLLSVINDIIRLSELDHMEIAKKDYIDLLDTVKSCEPELRVNAHARKVELTVEGEPTEVFADKDMMTEVIMNLVQNAIQYNNEGGAVKIYVGNEQAQKILRIEDNGIGIPKEAQERIFERFYRVDKSRSRATGGTGLGLSIVKHTVELHEAKLELQSEVGKGTVVTIRF